MLVRFKAALGLSAALIAVQGVAAWRLPQGYALAAVGDIVQTAVLLAMTAVMLLNMQRAQGRARAFWGFMAAGAALWLSATAMWTIYEVVQRREVPIPFLGDVLFFIHVVPFMSALGLRAHRSRHGGTEFAALDFATLMVWWVYLYLFIVIPWQYVSLDVPVYGFNFMVLYVLETALLVAMLSVICLRASGAWRKVYLHLLCASLVYVLGSQAVNAAITRGEYYTGSFYDLPLLVSMCWYIWAALVGGTEHLEPSPDPRDRLMPIWIARASMLAVLSIPVIGFVTAILAEATPQAVQHFRLYVTLGALFVLPAFVYLKQHLLDRQLVRLLAASEHNLDNLKRLQSQLVQTEKLSALGQLVGGAAHEINNPLTAILGYSDLLVSDAQVPQNARGFAGKIGDQARRTREIVSGLLQFAKQLPGEKATVSVTSVLQNAIELRQLDVEESIKIVSDLDTALPPVFGDANQLLQVFFHVMGNAVDAMKGKGGVLRVRSFRDGETACLEFADDGPGVQDPKKIFDPFYSTKPVGRAAGLGLSVCYGIVNDHQGLISCRNRPEGGALFTITLPLAPTSAARAVGASSRTG